MIDFDVGNFISRLVQDATAHNTLDSRTIEIFFQKSPSTPEGDSRGIEHLDYEIIAGGTVIQSGSTGADGKIELPVTGGRAELRLTFDGNPVAAYLFTLRDDAFEAANTVNGVQRRVRNIGYHLGHAGGNNDGIDGDLGGRTDKAILDFQIDNQLDIDGAVGTNTQRKLNDIVGGSAQT
jgi:peptidoglycan hydrolase-like protein with peptidoglycan-binding domain